MEIVILSLIALLACGFSGYVYHSSQKKEGKLLEDFQRNLDKLNKKHNQQSKEIAEMLMAGSYQEWSRIKTGGKPAKNAIKNDPNVIELSEDSQIPFDQIQGVKINNEPKRKIKLYA